MSTSANENNQAKLESIARGGTVEAGAFLFDSSGQVLKRHDGGSIRFNFEYGEAPYEVVVETDSESRVRLAGLFGVLPYTAECSEVRPLLLKLIESSKSFKRGQFSVNADMQIELRAETALPSPCTPASIMAAVVALLLEFKGCVGLLKDLLTAKAPMPLETEKPTGQPIASARLT